jgi:hypothetical protein
MTTLYLDTEYNGFGGELISMALVSPEGHKWYEVRELPNKIHPWVKEHVVPVLDKEPQRPLIFKAMFQHWLVRFKSPLIICDWYADAQHFCEMLSGSEYGTSLDFEFNLKCLKTPPNDRPNSKLPHNALADAKALMEWHRRKINEITPA